MNVVTQPTPDLAAVKGRQQIVWSSGNYAEIGVTLQITGERLAEALDVMPGDRVLDVAAGNGNMTLAAARRYCNVVSTDYVGAWLRNGMQRAEAEKLSVAFREADAEDLPFEDASFDVVTSTFGVMFTANQDAAASELARVCRSGGKIGMANWTPEGFIGDVFRTIGSHVKPPAGVRSPMEWSNPDRLKELFGGNASKIEIEKKNFVFRFQSPQQWIDLWKVAYGPMLKAFEAVGPSGAPALESELAALGAAWSRTSDAMVVPAEYAEVIVHRA